MAFALNLGFDLCSHDPPGAVARAAQLLYPLVAAQRLSLNFVKSLPEGLGFCAGSSFHHHPFFATFADPDFLFIPEMKPVCRFLVRFYWGLRSNDACSHFLKLRTGKTLSQYVINLQFRQACHRPVENTSGATDTR